jgi:hypothetical protein
MQILESALAFAITMLVLAMVVSALVETIHRILSMRESGLQYMLGQIFDQVFAKYLSEEAVKKLTKDVTILKTPAETLRKSFVERMSTNRAPMGVPPDATPTDSAAQVTKNPWWQFGLWSGRDLTKLTPAEFMERLGTIDIGDEIKNANDELNKKVGDLGAAAANTVDVVLKDVAQKFEAFGKEASAYFEGRARLLSVAVAVVLAFAVHVDAIELFNTFLRNPSVRANVLGQLDTVTKQYQEIDGKLDKTQKASDAAKAAAPKTDQAAAPPAGPAGQAAPATDQTPKTGQQEFEENQKALKDTIDKTKKTLSDLGDLGVPIGWNDERREAAKMLPIVWTCPNSPNIFKLGGACDKDKKDIWIQVPTVFSVYLYLFIGGMLIGLGGPFWYNAITSLTSIRNVASSVQGAAAPPAPAATGAAPVNPTGSKEVQPTTPVDVFKVAHQAKSIGNLPPKQDPKPGP